MNHGLRILVSRILQFGMKLQKIDSRVYLSVIMGVVFGSRYAKIHALHHVKTHYTQFTPTLESLVIIRVPSNSTTLVINHISARMRAVTNLNY